MEFSEPFFLAKQLGFHSKIYFPNLYHNTYIVSPLRFLVFKKSKSKEVKVWESNMTEIMLTIPPFELNGKEFNKLTFTKRVPAWRKPPEAEPKYFENKFKKKKFLGKERMCFFGWFCLCFCLFLVFW